MNFKQAVFVATLVISGTIILSCAIALGKGMSFAEALLIVLLVYGIEGAIMLCVIGSVRVYEKLGKEG